MQESVPIVYCLNEQKTAGQLSLSAGGGAARGAGASARHTAGTGGGAAAVVEAAAGARAAALDAREWRRHVDRAGPRIQRRPGVLVACFADDDGSAAPHDLRLFRSGSAGRH